MNRLSNTSINLYKECAYKYSLHYKQKLRSESTGSALIFGSALDKAISHLLTKEPGSELDVFEQHWKNAPINNVMVNIETSHLIKYSKSDFDKEIVPLTEELDQIFAKRDANGFESLTLEEKVLLNKANWDCLLIKGKLMIECFKRDILPNITEVLGLQVPIEVKSDTGDVIIGFADIVCRYKGYDKPIIFDLKTSARKYPENSVLESFQLGLYTFALSNTYEATDLAGYMVLLKTIKKDRQKICVDCGNDRSNTRYQSCDAMKDKTKCGGKWSGDTTLYAESQVLIGTITDSMQESLIKEAGLVNDAINDGNFEKNLDSCIGKYGRCVYYDYCHSGSTEGLIQIQDKKP